MDLLGFFSIKTLQDEKKIREFVQEAVQVLKSQNTTLATHPNSNIYGSLSQLVEFNGYYLESDPCLVCNNPEVTQKSPNWQILCEIVFPYSPQIEFFFYTITFFPGSIFLV